MPGTQTYQHYYLSTMQTKVVKGQCINIHHYMSKTSHVGGVYIFQPSILIIINTAWIINTT